MIVNNLIGFTTTPRDSQSSRFSSDLGQAPADPDFPRERGRSGCGGARGQMALDYRYEFGTHVIIDLIGYRRHGHSEVDDPTITQPLRYRKIQDQRAGMGNLRRENGHRRDSDRGKACARTWTRRRKKRWNSRKIRRCGSCRSIGTLIRADNGRASTKWTTGVALDTLAQRWRSGWSRIPTGFHIHPKVKKLLEQRLEMAQGKRPLDYGMAEALAFGTLLEQGTPVRLSGQDSRRGTFNQRHAALIDIENEEEYVPLEHLSADQAWFETYQFHVVAKRRCWDSNTDSAAIIRRRWCCGKRSSAISRTARRSSSTSSLRRAKTSGACCRA